jgi:hypothetical protein
LIEILNRPRQCAADWLVIQANGLANEAEAAHNPTLLVFSCLEARNAIEQLWAELLAVVHGGAVSKELFDRCRRQRDGFLAEIHRAEPQIYKLARFGALCLDVDTKFPYKPIVWDLKRLKRSWQELSRYCHAQAASTDTLDDPKWFIMGLSLVRDVYGYFKEQMSGGATAVMRPEAMNDSTRGIWEDFAAGTIDEAQTIIRLRLIQHV